MMERASSRHRRLWALLPGVFLVYVAAGKLGLRFALDVPSASPVWPPTGIALASVLLWGPACLIPIFLGAFVVNATTAGTIATSLGIAAGNTLEAGMGAWLVDRFGGGRAVFTDPRLILRFAALAGLVATAVSATLGVGSLVLGGQLPSARFAFAWLTWWLGDGAGAVLFAPLILLWARSLPPWHRTGRELELVMLSVLLVLIAALVFSGRLPPGLGYVGASIIVWAAFRFGQRVTATATIAWCAIALAGTLAGHGPFVRPSLNESLLLLQSYMAVLALTALAMSAAVRQRARSAETLEEAVLQRTRELSDANQLLRRQAEERRMLEAEREARLIEEAARHEAERLNRQKDDFLATVSHELRTPLGSVLGWAELLKHFPEDTGVRDKAVDAILRNARIQVRLISDMLDVSRIITKGRLELSPQPFRPTDVVATIVEQLRPEADKKRVRVLLTQDEAIPHLMGDPERLGQAIANVVGNAIKFSPEGGTVEVETRGGSAIEIQVSDQGSGVDPAILPSVFDRFTQADRSIRRRHSGLGLGLSIAKHIVDLHGGTIEAVNPKPGGARFTIRIPVGSATPSARPAQADGPGGEDAWLASSLRGLSVLIVDDDENAGEVIRAVLERCGADSRLAHSAAEGVTALRERAPDLLVVDLAMPEQDGYDFLGAARSREPRVPALALTAHASASEESRARQAGFDEFLSKPATAGALVAALVRLSRSASRSRPPLASDTPPQPDP